MPCPNPDHIVADVFLFFANVSQTFAVFNEVSVCVCEEREVCGGGGGGVVHTHPRTHNTSSFFLVVIGGAICNYEREKKATAHFLSSNQGNCYEIDVPIRHTHTYYNFFFSVIIVELIWYVQQKPFAQFPNDHGLGAVNEESFSVFWSVALV